MCLGNIFLLIKSIKKSKDDNMNNQISPQIINQKLEELEKIASDTLNKNNFSDSHVDIVKLIRSNDFLIRTMYLDDSVTGLLLVDDNNTILDTDSHRLIVVKRMNPNDEYAYEKSRFIAAHEFAHYLLHKRDKQQFAHRDKKRYGNIFKMSEWEADALARCILMPKSKVKKIVEKYKENSAGKVITSDMLIGEVARTFEVTPVKANQRLEELNIIGLKGSDEFDESTF